MSHFQSKRFQDLSENYEEINPIIELKKNRENSKLKVLDLTETNPTKLGFNYPKEMMLHEIANEFSWIYEPNPQGLQSAREAIQNYYIERLSTNVTNQFDVSELFHPDKFYLTSGTSEAYALVLKSITNPSDEILVQSPGYPLLDFLARWELVEPVSFESIADIESKITKRTRAIMIVQPNNPNGYTLSLDEIQAYESIAYKYNLVVIIDEVFADYVNSNILYHYFISNRVPVITVNGLSKLAGLPGWKLAWIHLQIPEDPESLWNEIPKRLEWLTDSYLSVNSIVQEVLPTILSSRHMIQNQIRSRIRRNYGKAMEILADKEDINIPEYNGGWYINISIELNREKLESLNQNLLSNGISKDDLDSIGHPDELFAITLLQQYGIYLHTGSMFNFSKEMNEDSNDKIRIILILSLIVKEEDFHEAILGLSSLCSSRV
ncbi:pyridoxal phosphate-dependent aminotransferase [Leptospira sp. GIMC2001]|uniref:pyridoxal phosphate-dependent aminotransferase n=1 Tax=Leptospira sp. GIMC2001 TaxID=1513297 RepID=UPI0023491312|nr:pyridoxal phosphate-dependent aminotransferase [Leptospira sp. GIMC2001]WCL49218.1 pyridoxal phosphate-dependent aminotransferase [Leptospira sp. GIMC2001]